MCRMRLQQNGYSYYKKLSNLANPISCKLLMYTRCGIAENELNSYFLSKKKSRRVTHFIMRGKAGAGDEAVQNLIRACHHQSPYFMNSNRWGLCLHRPYNFKRNVRNRSILSASAFKISRALFAENSCNSEINRY